MYVNKKLKGKLELHKNHVKDIKKMHFPHMLRGGVGERESKNIYFTLIIQQFSGVHSVFINSPNEKDTPRRIPADMKVSLIQKIVTHRPTTISESQALFLAIYMSTSAT